MTPQHERLIIDNPNLSHSELARFIGVDYNKVRRFRVKHGIIQHWKHKGVNIPLMTQVNSADRFFYVVAHCDRVLFKGRLDRAIETVDRLIYCLENNNGKLPRTFNDLVFGDLEFIKKG